METILSLWRELLLMLAPPEGEGSVEPICSEHARDGEAAI